MATFKSWYFAAAALVAAMLGSLAAESAAEASVGMATIAMSLISFVGEIILRSPLSPKRGAFDSLHRIFTHFRTAGHARRVKMVFVDGVAHCEQPLQLCVILGDWNHQRALCWPGRRYAGFRWRADRGYAE